MQTVITWTKYDGTPETLPEKGPVVFYWRGGHAPFPVKHAHHEDGRPVFVHPDTLRQGWLISPGDLWAYIPERPAAPQEVE